MITIFDAGRRNLRQEVALPLPRYIENGGEKEMSISREQIVKLLDENIEKNARKWGTDDIYTKWARDRKEKVLDVFDKGLEPVPVAEVDWTFKDGFDICSVLYTDGSIRKEIYRM